MTEPFDESKLYLGALCSRGHDWDGTGRSLRYKSNKTCVDCTKKGDQYWRLSNPEKARERHRRWRQANFEHDRQRTRRWHDNNRKKVREKDRRWRESNPEYARQWRKSNPEATKTYQHRRRARKVAALTIHYNGAELAAHFAQFDGCAYCGAPEQTLDHFFPLSHDLLAADALINIVPACKRCNCSKRDSHPVRWYKSQPFYDPDRLQRIIDILGIGKP